MTMGHSNGFGTERRPECGKKPSQSNKKREETNGKIIY
jgi:hypothetical protein